MQVITNLNYKASKSRYSLIRTEENVCFELRKTNFTWGEKAKFNAPNFHKILSYFLLADIFTVFCDVKSNPAVFGNDVRISCRHNGICFENLTRTWITGPNKDLLFMDGYRSHFSERYEEHNISCSEFELVIANFSKSDLNNTYRCSYDFEECVLPLSIESANFECK